MSNVVQEFKYEALLHDAAEAFIGDVTRPLKQLMPEYKRLEATVEDAVAERFALNRDYRDVVKAADLSVLAAEQAQVMAPGTDAWAKQAGISPAAVTVRFLPPRDAKREFLSQFHALAAAR